MGILNVTPDSFSGDGTMRNGRDWITASVDTALRMEDDGADIIDIGGESTRPVTVYPDARPVPADDELERVLPVITALSARCDVPISIDTRKSRVADVALSEGASMANDVSMLSDSEMATIAAKHDAPIVISHIRAKAQYDNVATDIIADLREAVSRAEGQGVARENIIVDPGIGFVSRLSERFWMRHLRIELKVMLLLPRLPSLLESTSSAYMKCARWCG